MNQDRLHPQAADGFSQGAHTYAKARPDYPEETLAWLNGALSLGSGSKVLEVGAGTGKFTQRLLQTGAAVLALEPVEAMRSQLQARYPTVAVTDGLAERLPFEDESFDAVVCAQAFHWFARPEVLNEFARVLKPDGTLGLIWNVRDESVEWVRKLGDLWREGEVGLPRYTSAMVTALFPHSKFGLLRADSTSHEHTGPAELVVIERMRSTSFVASMPLPEQEHLLARAREVLESDPEVRGLERLSFPYRTDMYSVKRRAT